MARIRTIKPGFWKHEDLSELPAETHMLAASLLNYADDEGYFNANPKLVAAECCPLREDSVNVHEQLTQLENIGYIRRAKGTDGKTYGHVVTFLEHQRINRPYPSEIKELVDFTEHSVNTHTPVTTGKGKGMEKEWNSSTPTEYSSDFHKAMDIYNRVAEQNGLAKAQKLSDPRKRKLKSRFKDCGGIDGWTVAMEKLAASDFLCGRVKDWRCDFDFILQFKNFTKLMEGGYDNNPNKPGGSYSETSDADSRAVLEAVGLGGVDSGYGGSANSEPNAAGGSQDRIGCKPGTSDPGPDGGGNQKIVDLRAELQHSDSRPQGHRRTVRREPIPLAGGPAGNGSQTDHRGVEVGQSSANPQGNNRLGEPGDGAASDTAGQRETGDTAQATGEGATDQPGGSGGSVGEDAHSFPDLPPTLDRKNRA